MSPPSRARLRAHLLAARIAGEVATPRSSNVGNIRRMLAGEPHYTFGLPPREPRELAGVLAVMASYAGLDPDPGREDGPDTIDPERTLAGLDALAARLGRAAARRERVLLATGHPTGLLGLHALTGQALASAGARLLRPADGAGVDLLGQPARIRYVLDVAMVRSGGELAHTHLPQPMRVMLAALEAAGEPPPDLVVADHGFAGAAAAAGVETVGYADSNDPALFVGQADGLVRLVVPLDDNVTPALYDPLAAYLTAALRPAAARGAVASP